MAGKKTIAIIQARMGSERFPGKTMYKLAGKPSIAHLLDAVSQVFTPDNIFVATSVEPANDLIESFVKKYGANIYRGDEYNVAGRFLEIIKAEQSDMFVRFNADSPLLDFRIIKKARQIMAASRADIVSTALSQSFPSGMNVEVLQSRVFQNAYNNFKDEEHFEHVTRYFYENSDNFKIGSLPCPVENPRSYKFTFDTEEDARKLEAFFHSLQLPHYKYSLEQKCEIYRKLFGSINNC
ncbi:MAG: cytidylyltransferase domain-containing protein [Smithellaceae bacterium]